MEYKDFVDLRLGLELLMLNHPTHNLEITIEEIIEKDFQNLLYFDFVDLMNSEFETFYNDSVVPFLLDVDLVKYKIYVLDYLIKETHTLKVTKVTKVFKAAFNIKTSIIGYDADPKIKSLLDAIYDSHDTFMMALTHLKDNQPVDLGEDPLASERLKRDAHKIILIYHLGIIDNLQISYFNRSNSDHNKRTDKQFAELIYQLTGINAETVRAYMRDYKSNRFKDPYNDKGVSEVNSILAKLNLPTIPLNNNGDK